MLTGIWILPLTGNFPFHPPQVSPYPCQGLTHYFLPHSHPQCPPSSSFLYLPFKGILVEEGSLGSTPFLLSGLPASRETGLFQRLTLDDSTTGRKAKAREFSGATKPFRSKFPGDVYTRLIWGGMRSGEATGEAETTFCTFTASRAPPLGKFPRGSSL